MNYCSENKAGQGGGREAWGGGGGTGMRRTGLRQLPSQTGCAERVKHGRAGDARQPWTAQRSFKGLDNICFSWLREPCSSRVSEVGFAHGHRANRWKTGQDTVCHESKYASQSGYGEGESKSLLSLQLVLSSPAAQVPILQHLPTTFSG